MKPLFVIPLVVTGLLGGCASEPTWEPPPLTSGGWTAPAATASTLPTTAPSGGLPQRQTLNSLTLEQAMERAQGHPTLAEARAQVQAAGGRLEQAGLFPNPELIGRVESAPLNGRTAGDAEYLAGVSQAIPLGDRLGAARRVERLDQQRLELAYHVRRIEVRRTVHGAFATALYAQQVVETQGEAVKAAENGVAIAKARVAAGDAVPEEQARAEMELARTRLELSRSRALRAQALTALAAAMGDAEIAIDSVAGELAAVLEVPALEQLARRLMEGPVGTSLGAEAAVEHARLQLAKAQRIPDLNLELLYRHIGENDTPAFDAGVRIALPVFDRNQGRIREARANILAAQSRARASASALLAQLEIAHSKLTAALATARTLREDLLPRAETILAAAQRRYRAGDTSLSEVLLIQRDRAATKLAYLEALRDVMSAWSDLAPWAQTPQNKP